MSRDDPFAEPSDTERTVIRPNPGGRRPQAQAPAPAPAAAPPPQAQRPVHAAAGAETAPATAMTGLNPLNAAASTLFSLIARIRNRAQHANPDGLRQSVIQEIRAFESRALQSGVEAQQVKIARYAICATVDDVVLNTPWGGQSVWTQQSLVGTFHKETVGGERFFDLLAKLEQDPANNRQLLEFLYVCLSLGFEGRLRVENRGTERLLTIREGLAKLIRAQRGPLELELSPRWKGLNLPHKPLNAWGSVWLIGGITLLLLALAYLGFVYALSGNTERLQGQLAALQSTTPVALARVAPPPPPQPAPPPAVGEEPKIDKLREFLAPEIREGLVEVFEDVNTITVRLTGNGMFGSGSDTLLDKFIPVVDRVALALNTEPGRVIVAGHSDSIPIATARFPNNTALSLARAKSVMTRMGDSVEDPSRMSAEGRADKEPIADNGTSEGRARNRRIEIVIVKAG